MSHPSDCRRLAMHAIYRRPVARTGNAARALLKTLSTSRGLFLPQKDAGAVLDCDIEGTHLNRAALWFSTDMTFVPTVSL